MTDRERYHQQLSEIRTALGNIPMPIVTIFMHKEIERLPHILEPDEKIIHAVTGNWKGKKHGLLTATDKRLIFLSYTILRSFEEIFSYEHMFPLQCEKGLYYGDITIRSEKTVRIETVNNNDNAVSFCQTVNAYLTDLQGPPVSENAVSASENIYQLLENLGSLREKGILTELEFTEQKKKLLEKL